MNRVDIQDKEGTHSRCRPSLRGSFNLCYVLGWLSASGAEFCCRTEMSVLLHYQDNTVIVLVSDMALHEI